MNFEDPIDFGPQLSGYDTEQQRQIAHETMERYSGSRISLFQPHIILTNFHQYVNHFAKSRHVKIYEGNVFKVAHSKKERITILDFKIGSPAAALVIDLCSFLPVESLLLLGMCGGLRSEYKIGDYFVPISSIRGDGTSDFYFPPEVPALANFTIQRCVTELLDETKTKYHIGITHTTNKRFWEFNSEFRLRLKANRAQAIEMECATLFTASYSHRLSLGALLLISDLPLDAEGIKTKKIGSMLFLNHMAEHIDLGVRIIKRLDKLQLRNKRHAHLHKRL